ncbi:MAG: hypothetical protein AB8G86_30590 [Saprospiraceae bacterium]
MIKISTISLVLLTLLALGIGGAIAWFWKKRSEGTWKVDFLKADKANKSLEKQVAKKEKDLNRLKKQNQGAKGKLAEIETIHTTKLNELKEKLAQVTADNAATKTSEQAYKSTAQQLKTELDRSQKLHKKLEEKYKKDTTNLKEWTTDRASFNRQFKDVKNKLKLAEEKIARLTGTIEKQNKEINENKAFVANLRSLKAQNKKFKEDLKYWEKKHYDTHHELATLKSKVDGVMERNQELEMVNQSAAQSNQQMLQKVQEFKVRFVDMNNKYHKLLERQKN